MRTYLGIAVESGKVRNNTKTKKGGESMLGISCVFWHSANRIGLLFVALFAICFAWYFINPSQQALHAQLFQLSYFGYGEMNIKSFILGAVQSYLWAYIAVGLWHLLGYCLQSGGTTCKADVPSEQAK
ncbi:hypothetical protein HYV71_03075 [Candidatus Uhrbacteria bacterium]|nr:hypothetical protein [Candidatus Uhrbacteria bacterium]